MGQKEREMEMDYNYRVRGSWEVRRNGVVSAEGITEPNITFSAPVEFKGESGHWTPEHFLVVAVVSCFIVTFSAMAESSRLNFLSLDVSAEGQLRKVDGKLAFAAILNEDQATKNYQRRGNIVTVSVVLIFLAAYPKQHEKSSPATKPCEVPALQPENFWRNFKFAVKQRESVGITLHQKRAHLLEPNRRCGIGVGWSNGMA